MMDETSEGNAAQTQSDNGPNKDIIDSSKQTVKVEVKDDVKKDAPIPVSFFTLFRYSTPFDILLDVTGFITAIAAGAAEPVLALLMGELSLNLVAFATTFTLFQNGEASQEDLARVTRDFRRSANLNSLYVVIVGIVVLACSFFYMYSWAYTGEVNSKRIREKYLEAVLKQDIAFFDDIGAGEVATRIQSDTHLIQQGISEKVTLVAHFIAAFISGFVIAYTQSWRLALAMTSILPATMITGGVMGSFMTRYTLMSTDSVASAGNIAEEAISTVRTAKAFDLRYNLGHLFDNKVSEAGEFDIKNSIAQGTGYASFFFIVYAAYGLAFSFGTTLINRGLANAGDVVTVFSAIFIGSLSLTAVAPFANAIIIARGAGGKIFATIDREPVIDSSSTSGEKLTSVTGDITIKDISFSYPSRPDVTVLQNLSMSFEAGKSYALVGPSGSGKSTIIALLERFYDAQSGEIQMDGHSIATLNLKWLRQQIGLVSQEPVLFGTTVKHNVAFGLVGTPHQSSSDEIKMELIKQACIKANAHDFIQRLPQGYDTNVGERGLLLSGGQKQRIAIARASISDPRILLLDEATSALDTQSEEVVQDALAKASEGRTTITIAHRLSTIMDSDKIYVMSGGRIAEEGSHEDLLKLEGVYTRLIEAQGMKKQRVEDTPQMALPPSSIVKKVDKELVIAEDIPREKSASATVGPPSCAKSTYTMKYLFGRMFGLVKTEWKSFVTGWLLSIVAGLIYPAFGIVYALSIDGFAEPGARERRVQGDRNALWFFIIAILSALVMGGQNYYLASAAAKLTARLRKLIFQAVMRQDVEFFDKEINNSGTLTARINGDPGKVNRLAGITLGTIIQGFGTVVAGMIVGLVVVWQVGLVGMACTPLLLWTGYSRLQALILKDERDKEAHQKSAQLACEATAAIRTVAALTRENGCLDEYKTCLAEPLRSAVKTGAISTFLYALAQAMMYFVIALVFWFGSLLFSRSQITVFELYVGLMTTTLGAIQAGGMFQFAPDISAAMTAAGDIVTLLDSTSAIETSSGGNTAINHFEGRIEAKDIRFSYPTRPNLPVLKGLSFVAEHGQYIAFVGASGCGKSTIIQLLQRFYDIHSGSILIDNQNLSDLPILEYRKHVALVSQEPTLYSGTIKFNILLGATKSHDQVTQEEIEEVCRKANILDFIKSLPDGFETQVGNKGSQLSGGQKQRIAIARALIRKPKILLLDEATSALDTASEKVVQAALDEAVRGRTTIAIAHRLSTIQDADKIYFIKDGRVSEVGTHNELLALRGDYSAYVQLQTLQQS